MPLSYSTLCKVAHNSIILLGIRSNFCTPITFNNFSKASFSNDNTIQTCPTQNINSILLVLKIVLDGFKDDQTITFDTALVPTKILKELRPHT